MQCGTCHIQRTCEIGSLGNAVSFVHYYGVYWMLHSVKTQHHTKWQKNQPCEPPLTYPGKSYSMPSSSSFFRFLFSLFTRFFTWAWCSPWVRAWKRRKMNNEKILVTRVIVGEFIWSVCGWYVLACGWVVGRGSHYVVGKWHAEQNGKCSVWWKYAKNH